MQNQMLLHKVGQTLFVGGLYKRHDFLGNLIEKSASQTEECASIRDFTAYSVKVENSVDLDQLASSEAD